MDSIFTFTLTSDPSDALLRTATLRNSQSLSSVSFRDPTPAEDGVSGVLGALSTVPGARSAPAPNAFLPEYAGPFSQSRGEDQRSRVC